MNFGRWQTTSSKDIRLPRTRLVGLTVFILVVLGVMTARLVELAVVHGEENRRRAEENRILIRPVRAPRGVILDRRGRALTRNVPGVRLVDLPGDDLGPVTIEEAVRSYLYGRVLAHVVGYVGEISEEELRERSNLEDSGLELKKLRPGDTIGKTGLEKQYDDLLRGIDGAQLVEVDANGQVVRVAGEEVPIPGRDLETNLDVSLLQAMVQALENQKGAAVAVDPKDGRVLGMVSNPGFDPGLFGALMSDSQIVGESERDVEIRELLSDSENLPLFNRAIGGEYPPGSVFKLVTASAGLAEGKLTESTKIEDTGEIRIGEFRYGNWYFDQYGRKEGTIGLVRAITRSNDIFFYKVGEWVGPSKLAHWARSFGLGEVLGVDLPGEADGLVPDPDWKERQIGERWFLGNTYHLAIGQGDIRLTPLQAAMMTGAVVTGKQCVPRIAKLDQGSTLAKAEVEPLCEEIGISPDHRAMILEGMIGACSPGGTAFPFFPWNADERTATASGKPSWAPKVACKTGTAQHGGEETTPHAWLTVVAPVVDNQLNLESDKRIVLVVLLESAGEGSYEAAPVAKKILEEWFKE